MGRILTHFYIIQHQFKVSLIYVVGHVLLSVGAIPYLDHTLRSTFDFGGLIVIALATGGIKPCVSSFAADQVKILFCKK